MVNTYFTTILAFIDKLELISIFATFAGIACFAAVFTILYLSYVKSATTQIETGKRDIELIDMALNERSEKTKRNRKIWNTVKTVLFVVFLAIIIPVFVFSLINRISNKPVFGVTFMVVASPSMSEKNEVNTYLVENDLNDQFDTYDIIFLRAVKSVDELKQYDVIAFVNDEGTNIIHRIVSVTGSGEDTKFVTRGDKNDVDDTYKPSFDDVIGVYTGKHIGFVGMLVLFLQSYAGIITVVAMLYCLIMIDHVSRKIEKREQQRLDQLLGAIESDETTAKAMRAEFKETIYYRGYAYRFDESGFIDKSEIPQDEEQPEEDTMLKIIDDGSSTSSETILIKTRKQDDNRKDK